MKTFFTFAFLLLPCFLWAAQTFTLKQGPFAYGPINANVLHKKVEFELSKIYWKDPNVKLVAVIDISFDKGNTYPFHCKFASIGDGASFPKLVVSCPMLKGATTFKISGNVTGGDIVLPELPKFNSKP